MMKHRLRVGDWTRNFGGQGQENGSWDVIYLLEEGGHRAVVWRCMDGAMVGQLCLTKGDIEGLLLEPGRPPFVTNEVTMEAIEEAMRRAGYRRLLTLKERLDDVNAKIKALEAERLAIYQASLEAPAEEKACHDLLSSVGLEDSPPWLEFPVTLSGIHWSEGDWFARWPQVGFVSVRPCDDKYKDKTYLGVVIGNIAMSAAACYHRPTGILTISHSHLNVLIWIPDAQTCVFGAECWWKKIQSVAELQAITDADINAVWYVQALKVMTREDG